MKIAPDRFEGGPQTEDHAGVDAGGRQQDLAQGGQRALGLGGHADIGLRIAERAPEPLLVGLGQVEVVFGDQRADEREPVGVEARRGQADDRVPGPDGAAVDDPVAFDGPDAEAGEVERVVGP